MSWNHKLDGCPFCGKRDDCYVERMTTCVYQVKCTNCGALGPSAEHMRHESDDRAGSRMAAKLWNNRSVSEPEGKAT